MALARSSAPPIRQRMGRLDWAAVARSLDERGYAKAGPVLTPAECARLCALYPDDRRFRKRIDMERYRFGVGTYAYLADPLPPLVRSLRAAAYRHLAPIANAWMQRLAEPTRFPATVARFLDECRQRGQSRPTPLLLCYQAGGYNLLHQDLYGEVVFPLQLTFYLSRPGIDYEGGESLLVEQRPRAQSRGEVIVGQQGEMLVFPTRERPVEGRRGAFRAAMRLSLIHI